MTNIWYCDNFVLYFCDYFFCLCLEEVTISDIYCSVICVDLWARKNKRPAPLFMATLMNHKLSMHKFPIKLCLSSQSMQNVLLTTIKNSIWFIFLVEVNCDGDNFNCSIGSLQCIPWLWVCDGDEDCTDGSDEADGLCGLLLINFIIAFFWYL